jgi:RNA exonuclease 1
MQPKKRMSSFSQKSETSSRSTTESMSRANAWGTQNDFTVLETLRNAQSIADETTMAYDWSGEFIVSDNKSTPKQPKLKRDSAAKKPAVILLRADTPETPDVPFQHRPVDLTHMSRLKQMLLPEAMMERLGFPMRVLSHVELQQKPRCSRCKKIIKIRKRHDDSADDDSDNDGLPGATAVQKTKVLRCLFHTGVVNQKHWSCCNRHVGDKLACSGNPEHIAYVYTPQVLEDKYQFTHTPNNWRGMAPRFAVAMDCEMGTNVDGDSELIRITMVDYETRGILIDRLVWPDTDMAHYNTRYSGVSHSQMEKARARRQCLFGIKEARNEIWKYVGPDTIVIGHSVYNDLKSLRWIHKRIVDSYFLEERAYRQADLRKTKEMEEKGLLDALKNPQADDAGDADDSGRNAEGEAANATVPVAEKQPKQPRKPKGSGRLSLKSAARIRLGRQIQAEFGHDSLEDALASRDITEWHVFNSDLTCPWVCGGMLQEWGSRSS